MSLSIIASRLGSLVFGVGFVLTLHFFAGCSASPNNGMDCASDAECTGDGTCMNGKCAVSSGDSSSSGSSGGGGGSSGSGSSSSGSGSSSSGMVQIPPACYQTCSTANDCTNGSTSPLLDADNWSCNAGLCQYTGCNSTQECTDSYMKSNYVCQAPTGATTKACYQTCSVPADCTNGSTLPILDADNWKCNAGVCEYTGCNSTQECTDSYMKTNYVCQNIPNSTTQKSCYQTCAAPADCTSGSTAPLTDADNWSCNTGTCEYVGCNSTQECTDTYMKTDYICK